MSILRNIIFVAFCFFYAGIVNAEQVKIETKNFGKDVIFVFYHDNDVVMDIKSRGRNVTVTTNIPVEHTNINSDIFNKYASAIRTANNNQLLTFTVNEELKYQSVIVGEKLDAIKFKAEKKVEEDLTKIGEANNDPDAVQYSLKGNNHNLSFNLESDDTKAAAFMRGKYLWIIYDKQKLFSFSHEGIFSHFAIIPSKSGTVIRIKIEEGFNQAKLNRTKNGWVVSVVPESIEDWKKHLALIPESLIEEDGYLIKGDFANHEIISFEDPEIGDTLKVVPVRSAGSRVMKAQESVDYKILNTLQGVAVSIHNDEVEVNRYDEAIKIVADTELDEYVVIDENVFPGVVEPYLEMPTILPYLDKNLDILDFNERKSYLIREASIADEESGFEKNLELAKFYFIHRWYHEAADVMEYAKKRYPDDYIASFSGRFLNAVSHTLKEEYSKAKDEYAALLAYNDIKKIPEVNIWSRYNNYSLGANPGSLMLQNQLQRINLYSDDKYWQLIFAEIELGLLANDLKAVEKLFKELRNPPAGKIANSLKYYRANYYRKKGQHNLAKQYFLDLVYRENDLLNSTRAEFDLTKLRLELDEIDLDRAIEVMDNLRFKWRGDQLEYEILLKLATYYRDNQDILNALRTYKYIQSAFANKISNFYVTSEMAKIFNDVFLPNGLRDQMDDFTLVALFYEFKELNPIGEKGDNVILEIARRLVKLDLLENAADLLRHQIRYRLVGEKRVANADNLSIVLMMDKKPREAMMVLDETDKDNFNFEEHQYRIRLRARALIDLENYEESISLLKDDTSSDAGIIRREATFRSKKWSDYVDLVGGDVDLLVDKLNTDEFAAQDILRLAISYYMLGAVDQLQLISALVGSKSPSLKDTIDLMSTSSGQIDVRNLDKSLNIDQMKSLLTKYKNQFLEG